MDMHNEVNLSVTLGIGGTVSAAVNRYALAACTIRAAIETVLKAPRASGSPEERTARMIDEALWSGRAIDIELSHGPENSPGRPVTFDDVVGRFLSDGVRSGHSEGTTMAEEQIHIGLSESYRGGFWL